MQDRESGVFWPLPPTIFRPASRNAAQGRFDEIFFVDLPSQAVRQALFTLHLKNAVAIPLHLISQNSPQPATVFPGQN